jgi:KaiC/GvpD/RAD55 family RecA-like ATPase
LIVLKLKEGINAWGCTNPDPHADSSIRAALIRESEDRESTWAEDEADRILRTDPVFWLRDRVRESRDQPEEKFDDDPVTADVGSLPEYATGFFGRESGGLLSLRGMTTLSGRASSGKTWFALGAALQSALDGWDVSYIAAEGSDVVKRRVQAAFGKQPPRNFHLVTVHPGATLGDIAEMVEYRIMSRRTLLVFDSISSLMGMMLAPPGMSRWDEQSKLEMFLMRIRSLTRGEVAMMIVSEANAQGEAKGRTLDHKSDTSINFVSVEDSDAKEVRVVKAWEGRTGLIGRARVDPGTACLRLIFDGPVSDAEPQKF